MSNAQPIVIRAAMKPISTLAHPLPSVNLQTRRPNRHHTSGATSARWPRQVAYWRTWWPLKSPLRWSISSAATPCPRFEARWKLFYDMAQKLQGEPETKSRPYRPGARMFQLHDKTRRRICLVAFGLFCLTPTALVAGWCVAWQLPGHLRAEVQRLQQQLGLTVELSGMRHLRPGVVVYEGLSLSDPETGQTVLRCPTIEAACTCATDEKGQARTTVLLTVPEGEIEAKSLDRFGQLIECLLQNQAGWGDMDVRLAAGAVTLRSGDNSQTLADVEATIEAVSGGGPGQGRFPPGRFRDTGDDEGPTHSQSPDQAARLWAGTRHRAHSLPCDLLAAGLTELKTLGPASRFCGHLWATQTPGGWTTNCQGKVSPPDPSPPVVDPDRAESLALRFGRKIE